jgi:TPR repeat protein
MFESKKTIETWVECGDDYYYGKNGEKVDYEMAVYFYEKAMKKKHPRATYMMGLCYELGRYVEKDLAHAETLYSTAAGYGDPDAKKRLKSGRQAEPAVPIIAERRETEQQGAAETAQNKAIFNKDDWVQQLLQAQEEGKRYEAEQQETKEKSYNKAVQDLERGLAYLSEGDFLNANESLSDAAEAGNTRAMVQLALMLISDMGEWDQAINSIYLSRWPNTDKPAVREGFVWLDRAAELGDSDAIAEKKRRETDGPVERGLAFIEAKEYPKAARCLLEAAEAGNTKAMWELHELFLIPEAAYDLSHGLIDVLGNTNRRGLWNESNKWLKKAIDLGEPNAIACYKRIQSGLTPEAKAREDRTHAEHMKAADAARKEREAAEQRRRQRAQSGNGSGPRDDWAARQNAENAEATRRAQKSREEAARLAQRSKEWHENH